MGGGGGIGGVLQSVGNVATLGMIPGMNGGSSGGGGGGGGIYMPMPTNPGYNSEIDPATGQMKAGLQSTWQGVTPDQSGLTAYQNMATGTGPTAQAQAQLAQQQLNNQQQQSSAQAAGAGSLASAQDQLASKYGLSSGAQQNLATQNMRNTQNALQGVGAQNATAINTIGANDAATRNQFLQGLPAAQNANTSLQMQNQQNNTANQQYNATNAINQNTGQNAYNLQNYMTQMSNWGNNQNANSMQNQGSGGKK